MFWDPRLVTSTESRREACSHNSRWKTARSPWLFFTWATRPSLVKNSPVLRLDDLFALSCGPIPPAHWSPEVGLEMSHVQAEIKNCFWKSVVYLCTFIFDIIVCCIHRTKPDYAALTSLLPLACAPSLTTHSKGGRTKWRGRFFWLLLLQQAPPCRSNLGMESWALAPLVIRM